MCMEAGLEVASVIGYDKGGFYEPTDIFVRADHSWNAVRIDGEWKLIDLSWSGGGLVLRKQLISKHLSKIFKLPFKFKYKFVPGPNFNYYLTDPEVFARDHLAAHPGWQLTKRIIPIEVFEQSTDSLNAFIKSGKGALNPYHGRVAYYRTLPYPQGHLILGKIGHQFNEKNFRILAEGEAKYAIDWYIETSKSKLSLEEKIIIYDSCAVVLREARKHIRSYIKYTRAEKSVRNKKNKALKKYSHAFSKQSMRENWKHRVDNIRLRKPARRQLEKLRSEQSVLKKEIEVIEDKELGLSKKELKADSILELSAATYLANATDNDESILLLRKGNKVIEEDIIAKLDQDILVNITSATWNNITIDSIIDAKVVNRIIFNWSYKYLLDSLTNYHQRQRDLKDRTLQRIKTDYKALLKAMGRNKKRSRETRKYYKRQLTNAQRANKKVTDSLRASNTWPDKFTQTQREWIEYNRKRIRQLDDQIALIKAETTSLVQLVNRHNNEYAANKDERKWERMRYSAFMRYYLKFYIREKRKASKYSRELKSAENDIEKTKEKSKNKLEKMELRQEKEDMRRLKSTR